MYSVSMDPSLPRTPLPPSTRVLKTMWSWNRNQNDGQSIVHTTVCLRHSLGARVVMTTLLLSHIFVFTMEKKNKGMGVGPGVGGL